MELFANKIFSKSVQFSFKGKIA